MSPRTVVLTIAASVVAACAALFPAGAAAAVFPTFGVDESAGNVAGSTSSVAINITFNATSPDYATTVSVGLPAGLMLNEQTDGGACLSTPTPIPACQVGSGAIVLANTAVPAQLYLIRPQVSSDLASVELVAGSLTLVGDLTFHSSASIGIIPQYNVGQQISFSGLPAAPVDNLNLLLTGLTMPSSCQPADVTVAATSKNDPTPATVSQPFYVTNCLALQYQPLLKAAISRDTGSTAANAAFTIEDPAGNSLTQSVKIRLPPNISWNPALTPCHEGVTCAVGTFTATSPLMPTSQLTATMVLGGTERQPTLAITFPKPTNLQLSTILSSSSLTLLALPQIPMTSIVLRFTGTPLGGPFVALCYKAAYGATFYPRSGGPTLVQNSTVGVGNCKTPKNSARAGKPTAAAAVAGLASGSPSLAVKAARGSHAPNIASLSISLPSGLSFNAAAAISSRALTVSGATIAGARIQHGKLLVSFRHASSRATLTLRGPLLLESASLRQHVSSHSAQASHLVITMTDSRGHQTRASLSMV